MLSIIQIIKEELQDFYDYGDEQSMVDRYYERNISNKPATQTPKEQINAELIGYVTKQWGAKLNEPIPVYKNPSRLIGFAANARGVLLEDGTFFLAPTPSAMHDNILDMLAEKGIVPMGRIHEYFNFYPDEFIAVQRFGTTDMFNQSSAYDRFPEYYQQIFDNANRRQPYEFKEIQDDNVNEIESPLDPNFQISNIPQGYDGNILNEMKNKVTKLIESAIGGFMGNAQISITPVEPDFRSGKNQPLTYSVMYEKEVNGELIEIEGTLTPHHTGRAVEYGFEPGYFTDGSPASQYWDENWEAITDEITDKFYDSGLR
jgi:hypothetical protein